MTQTFIYGSLLAFKGLIVCVVGTILLFFWDLNIFSALQHRGTTMTSTTMIKTDKSAVHFSGLGLSASALVGFEWHCRRNMGGYC